VTDDNDKLERFVSDLARGQPQRRAPASLHSRVMARIAQRHTALPWWRNGFSQWPLAARVAFVLVSFGFVKLALSGVMLVSSLLESRDSAGGAVLNGAVTAVSTTVSIGDAIVHLIPPMWLYGAAFFGFVLYALLFGLGTFAYRTLYVES